MVRFAISSNWGGSWFRVYVCGSVMQANGAKYTESDRATMHTSPGVSPLATMGLISESIAMTVFRHPPTPPPAQAP